MVSDEYVIIYVMLRHSNPLQQETRAVCDMRICIRTRNAFRMWDR